MSDTRKQSPPTTPEQITADVLASFEGTADPRLREIMRALVRHLHAFTSEVGLTPDEWTRAIEILTETGDITDEHRQEFVLWSDSLGVSMLVDAIENTLPEGATESTVLGPFYVSGSPLREYCANIALQDDAGVPALVHGRVLDIAGAPIPGAELDVWQNGTTVCTRCNGPRAPRTISGGGSSRARTAVTRSSPSGPSPIRFPTTGPWGGCSS